MHRLVNRAIDEFMRDTYGAELWGRLVEGQGDAPTLGDRAGKHRHRALLVAGGHLHKSETELFEDLGAWVARLEPVRRLLRFSGRDFPEFVTRLDELPGRTRLVVPDLEMPALMLQVRAPDHLHVALPADQTLWRAFLAGMIRMMADDYGALSIISVEGSDIVIRISDDAFFEGRGFILSSRDLAGELQQ